ncbi:MAG TPA: hypothetical protein VIT38_15355 [Allosphingosinicella sp.]
MAAKNPYDKKLGDLKFRKVPSCIYFYYIKLNDNGPATIKHYYYSDGDRKIHADDIPELVRQLGRNGREIYGVPPQHGEGFSTTDYRRIAWRRKSYIAFLLDNDDADAHFSKNNKNAFKFYRKQDATKNHSFFDGFEVEVDLSDDEDGSQIRTAVVCINHMKKTADGNDLGIGGVAEEDEYKFELNIQLNRASLTRAPDSGGTNMGPPVPPPFIPPN